MRHFKAGCQSQHISAWEEITSDQEVLQTVQGMKLEIQSAMLRNCLQNFLLLFMSLLTAKFVKNSHIWARIYFIFLKNVLKQN